MILRPHGPGANDDDDDDEANNQVIIIFVVGVCEGRTKPTQILQPRLNLSRS